MPGKARRKPKDVSGLITIVAIGLKPQANQTLSEAARRGYIVRSEVVDLVPDEEREDRARLSRTLKGIHGCLNALGIAVVPNGFRPGLMASGTGPAPVAGVGEPFRQTPAPSRRSRKVQARVRADVEIEIEEKEDTTIRKKAEEEPDWEWRAARDLVGRYLYEIGRFRLLSHEEVNTLAQRVTEDGDVEARNTIVAHNLRLTAKMARRYVFIPAARDGGLDWLDLMQEGAIGLLRAAELYNHRLGFHFSTYAMWWIRQAISRALVEKGHLVRMPSHRHEVLWRIRREIQRFYTQFGCEPSTEELAGITGMSPEKIERTLREVWLAPGHGQPLLELDRSFGGADLHPMDAAAEDDLHDLTADRSTLGPEEIAIARDELERALQRLRLIVKLVILSALSEREINIFLTRYGLDGSLENRTLRQVAAKHEITRERIRQLLEVKIWPTLKRLGLKKGERWLLQELERIHLLEQLTGQAAKL